MYRYFIVLLIFYTVRVFASEEYCVNRMPVYEEKLNSKEICKYSKSCLDIPRGKKVLMYCDMPHLSECFEGKAWQGIHDYLGVPRSTAIKGTSKRYKKENGEIKKVFCGTNTRKS